MNPIQSLSEFVRFLLIDFNSSFIEISIAKNPQTIIAIMQPINQPTKPFNKEGGPSPKKVPVAVAPKIIKKAIIAFR
tara:strand:+ start:161 stop:391 length:231 start_codon:yes stop_codon:yes gene_type:complete